MTNETVNIKIHEKPKKHDFLLSAKNFYLTYSNCSSKLETIISFLKIKLSSYIVQDYIAVQENHESGELHVHIFLKLLKKALIKSPTFLDFIDDDGKTYHGNYQTAKKRNSVIEYMLKDISVKTDPKLYYSPSMSNLIGEIANFKTLSESLIDLAEEGKIVEAMEFLKKEDPDMYLKQGNKLQKRLIDIYKDQYMKTQREYNIDKFYISSDVYESLIDYIRRKQNGENPVLALVGNARHR
jgi:hypothetical protein